MQQLTLRLTEIFFSLQGETNTMGIPTVFVRLTGCPLRCQYCDTAYAFQGGKITSIDSIMEEVGKYKTRYVTVTGGEPLAQKNCLNLLTRLCDQNYRVSLETSGALSIAAVDPRVVKILDVKTPGSGEVNRNDFDNFAYLNPNDEIKFVICSREDYLWSKEFLQKHNLPQVCTILFSPSYQQVNPQDLAAWILEDALPVRMQIQLHKILWGEKAGV